MIEKDIRQYLDDSLDEAVFFMRALQDTEPPYVTVQLITPSRYYSHEGYEDMMRPTMQVDCYAKGKIEVKELAQDVIDLMHDWPAQQSDERPDYNETSELYRLTLRFFVEYYEGVS